MSRIRLTSLVVALVAAACTGGGTDASPTSNGGAVTTTVIPMNTEAVTTSDGPSTSATVSPGPVVLTVVSSSTLDISPGVQAFVGDPLFASRGDFVGAEATAAVVLDDSLLLVGSTTTAGELFDGGGFETRDFFTDAIAWMSDDGLTWALTEAPRAPGDVNEVVHDVVVHDGGIVAVGEWNPRGLEILNNNGTVFFVSEDTDAAVWISSDGSDWGWVDDDDLGGDLGESMAAVTQGGPGLVAVGSTLLDDPATFQFDLDAAVWVSEDGRDWERVTGPPEWVAPGNQQLVEIVSFGDLLITVGEDSGAPSIWYSRDGIEWHQVADLEPGPGFGSAGDVTVADTMVVAVGSAFDDADRGLVWHSVDGVTWSAVSVVDIGGGLQTVIGLPDGRAVVLGHAVDGESPVFSFTSMEFRKIDVDAGDVRFEFAALIDDQLMIVGPTSGDQQMLVVLVASVG